MTHIESDEQIVMINPSHLRPTESINWAACPDSLNEYEPLIVDKDLNILDGHHRFMFIHRLNRLSSARPWLNISKITEYPVIIR